MRAPFLIALVFWIAAGASGASAQSKRLDRSGGLLVQEFRALAASLPPLKGEIKAIRLLRNPRSWPVPLVAMATSGEETGWQLYLFGSADGKQFTVEWQSGRLDDAMAGAGPDDLSIFSLRDEEVVVFQGCAAHVCPDVFSILIYSPLRRATFIAKSVWGRTTYSFDEAAPANAPYKRALDQLVRERKSPFD